MSSVHAAGVDDGAVADRDADENYTVPPSQTSWPIEITAGPTERPQILTSTPNWRARVGDTATQPDTQCTFAVVDYTTSDTIAGAPFDLVNARLLPTHVPASPAAQTDAASPAGREPTITTS